MEDVRRFAKDKLDITEEDVINYINRHKPRFVLAAIVRSLQFLVVFFFMRGTGWKDRYFLTKLWVLLWVVCLMTLLETLRYSDFLFKKYGIDKYLGGGGGGEGGGHSNRSGGSNPGSSPKPKSKSSSGGSSVGSKSSQPKPKSK